MRVTKNNSILVLGASSWIGNYLLESLKKYFPNYFIVGSYRSNKICKDIDLAFHFENSDLSQLESVLLRHRPDYIFNLNRGENDDGLSLNRYLIDWVNKNMGHYCYFSSFNAVDENIETEHYEDEQPHAKSDYGKFKAECERGLIKNCRSYCIFRFSATHGFAPHRASRTVSFLEKLIKGETVKVNRGVIQNRTETSQLTDMMSAVAKGRGQGIFNLGSIDSSEEVEFLRKLAIAFGYPEHRVIDGELNRCNANMVPEKIFSLCGDEFKFFESESIERIRKTRELAKYINNDSKVETAL